MFHWSSPAWLKELKESFNVFVKHQDMITNEAIANWYKLGCIYKGNLILVICDFNFLQAPAINVIHASLWSPRITEMAIGNAIAIILGEVEIAFHYLVCSGILMNVDCLQEIYVRGMLVIMLFKWIIRRIEPWKTWSLRMKRKKVRVLLENPTLQRMHLDIIHKYEWALYRECAGW